MGRIKSLKIDKRRDIILVEKILPDGTVLSGTRFYCGCCGQQMGTLTSELKFPFGDDVLIKAFGDSSIRWKLIFEIEKNLHKWQN